LAAQSFFISDRVYSDFGRPKSLGKLKLDLAGVAEREFDYLGVWHVKVLAGDRESDEVEAYTIYFPGKSYSLISDELIDKLGIEILAPGEGTWRFRDDPPNKKRKTLLRPKIRFEEILKEILSN